MKKIGLENIKLQFGHLSKCNGTLAQLDHARIKVIGHSRLALTALWCAAMDMEIGNRGN